MFGLFGGKKDQAAKDGSDELAKMLVQRAEALIQRIKLAATKGDSAELEAINKVMAETLKRPEMPADKRKHYQDAARAAERDCWVKACDDALDRATSFAQADRDRERAQQVQIAREALKKAILAGAPAEYRQKSEHRIAIIAETGGVRHKGPTAAKPGDIAAGQPAQPPRRR